MGRAPHTKETLLDFCLILGPGKKGLNGVVSGYPTSTNLPRVEGLSTDSRDLGCHSFIFKLSSNHKNYFLWQVKKGKVVDGQILDT